MTTNETLLKSRQAWHAEQFEAVLQELNSSPLLGLSAQEASERLREMGPNQLPRAKAEGGLGIFLKQFKSPLIYVLLAATALAIGLGKMTDGIVVFSVVILNSVIGFVQERQAGRAIQALLRMIPETATVIRDGRQENIASEQLVPGDLVVLQAGDRVSADLRLTMVKNLQCDESALTGESAPVSKETGAVLREAMIGDRKDMAFGGTTVTAGTGKGVVVATGGSTEFGRISEMLERTQPLQTPLMQSLERIAKWITFSILVVVAGLLVIGIFRGYEILDAAFSGITLAVATIPEGLPAIVTIISAIGVRRMARRKAIIRHLPAVETLGSTTVICTDKTGTLTRNQMTVRALWVPEAGELQMEESSAESLSQTPPPAPFLELLKGAVLCSDASLEVQSTQMKTTGDPTEVALVVAAHHAGVRESEVRESHQRIDVIPFDSDRKIMATLHQWADRERVLFLKGAPESVVGLCTSTQGELRDQARQKSHAFAVHGMRVIAVARKVMASEALSIGEADLQDGFELLGIEAMIDPPRAEARKAIELCQEAGIVIKMITGDHPETARAIGKELNIAGSGDSVVSGVELEKMNDHDLVGAAANAPVFARVAPEHKLRLVEALQTQGHVVAMTGDGVNDAPALKRADIGIAMGISGTAVAKESADMVLADDNFTSIEAAVEEGRRVYDNLTKSIAFILPTSVGQGLVILITVLFFPVEGGHLLRTMEPVQALWVNLITGVTLAVPLAFEAMEPDVMQRPPRSRSAPILNRLMIFRTLFVSLLLAGGATGLFLWEYYSELGRGTAHGLAYAEAQSMAVTAIVLFQIFYLFNCRSLKYPIYKIGLFANKWIFLGIALTLLAQLGFIYLPVMNRWFHSGPLTLEAWLLSTAVAFVVLPIIAFEKWFRLKFQNHEEPIRKKLRPLAAMS